MTWLEIDVSFYSEPADEAWFLLTFPIERLQSMRRDEYGHYLIMVEGYGSMYISERAYRSITELVKPAYVKKER